MKVAAITKILDCYTSAVIEQLIQISNQKLKL